MNSGLVERYDTPVAMLNSLNKKVADLDNSNLTYLTTTSHDNAPSDVARKLMKKNLYAPGELDTYVHTALNEKKCLRCHMQPAVVACQDCHHFLCRGCLVKERHPVDHRLHPVPMGVEPGLEEAPSPPQIRAPRQKASENCPEGACLMDNGGQVCPNFYLKSRETEAAIALQRARLQKPDQDPLGRREMTMCCRNCRYAPCKPGDSNKGEPHENHTLIPIADGAVEIKKILRDQIRKGAIWADKAKECQFQARERELELLVITNSLKDILKRACGQVQDAISHQRDEGQWTLETGFDQQAQRTKFVEESMQTRRKIVSDTLGMYERMLVVGERHNMAGINAYHWIQQREANLGPVETENKTLAMNEADASKEITLIEQDMTALVNGVEEQMEGFEQEIRTWIKETEFTFAMVKEARDKFAEYGPELTEVPNLCSLREASSLKLMTGVPILPRGLAARATLPYWTEWGSPDMSGLLYRIDTFHPQWDLVRVAVYKQSWLAIFTLDPHTVNVMQSQENPFWLKGGQPTDPFPPSPWQMEGLDVETPPENMIALKEVTVNKVEGESAALSPVAKLIQSSKKPALEIIRYSNNVPITYWLLGASTQHVIDKWYDILDKAVRDQAAIHMSDMNRSLYTPSTNPRVRPEDIGIELPPQGYRWAAFHAAASALAESGLKHRNANEEDDLDFSAILFGTKKP